MADIGKLTELEGAVLGVIERRRGCTAYQVRKEFLDSPSAEWSGSAGAVYPAIARLAERDLVTRNQLDRGEALSLSPAGRKVFRTWTEDADRAAGAGIDPFRLRAGFLLQFPAERRRRAAAALRKKIEAEIATIETLAKSADPVETAALDLTMDLQRARLSWLDRFMP